MEIELFIIIALLIYFFIFTIKDNQIKKQTINENLKIKRTEFMYRYKKLPKNIP